MKCKYSLLNKALSKFFKRLRTGNNNLISILLRYGNLIDSLLNVHFIGTFVHAKQIIGPSFQWSRHFFDMCNVLEAMRSFNNNYGGIHLTINSLIAILTVFKGPTLSILIGCQREKRQSKDSVFSFHLDAPVVKKCSYGKQHMSHPDPACCASELMNQLVLLQFLLSTIARIDNTE